MHNYIPNDCWNTRYLLTLRVQPQQYVGAFFIPANSSVFFPVKSYNIVLFFAIVPPDVFTIYTEDKMSACIPEYQTENTAEDEKPAQDGQKK